MINHARTLLLNVPHDRMQLQDVGYEYIPPNFRPVVLNTALSTLRRAIFGTSPDNYFLNFRSRELLGYMHETELVQYVTQLDNRITYWPPTGSNFFENAKTRVTITQTAGLPLRLNFGGTFAASNATGTSTHTYDVILKNVNGTVTVNTQQTNKPASVLTTEISPIFDQTPISLAETNLRFKVNFAATAPNPNITTAALITETAELIVVEEYDPNGDQLGLEIEPTEFFLLLQQAGKNKQKLASTLLSSEETARWQITVRSNPPPIIANIAALELLGEPLFLELFGLSNTEPYVTFKNLWESHPLPAYRISGLVLAMIYRTNEMLRANNG